MRILFIGNSFTARNDVPGLVAALAAPRGKSLEHRLLWAGGASLRMHWNKGDARREIERGRYDRVVLQEQSTLPIKNPARTRENVLLFDEVIRTAGAETVLYLTWARAKAPESQAALTRTYTTIADEIGAAVAPVGIAWQRVLAAPDHPELYDRDGSHPSVAGSYLAACVFLALLFDERPASVPDALSGLSAASAELLHDAAWTSVHA